jgi:predicted nucleic acid-binding protein
MALSKQKTVFVDTGAFYARYVTNDEHHKKSQILWKQLADQKLRPVTSNLVLSELITLLAYRFGSPNALIAAREVYSSNVLNIISVTRDVELKALDWLEKFSDQKFSFTDAASFACMSMQKIRMGFSFDRHFTVAGFELLGG